MSTDKKARKVLEALRGVLGPENPGESLMLYVATQRGTTDALAHMLVDSGYWESNSNNGDLKQRIYQRMNILLGLLRAVVALVLQEGDKTQAMTAMYVVERIERKKEPEDAMDIGAGILTALARFTESLAPLMHALDEYAPEQEKVRQSEKANSERLEA